MNKSTQEHIVYLSDDMYLPIQYKGIKVEQPFYPGDGICDVSELQDLCKQFKEYVHQQQVIKQSCKEIIVGLKFGIKFEDA